MEFAAPWWFLLLAVLPLMVVFNRRPRSALILPSLKGLKIAAQKKQLPWHHGGFLLRCGAMVCLICALARPQSGRSHHKQRSQGLDMMLVVDTSKSMMALDFVIEGKRQNRLEVARRVLREFIRSRMDDRLGLTIFGSHAFAYVPLTLDHDVLLRYLDEVEIGMAGDSTAIGDAIGVATNRLKELNAKNKIIILLTDGANQDGKADPLEAAKAAQVMGVRVYTIGIGSNDLVPIPTPLGIQKARFELDEELLQKIAQLTDGRYFKASDTETLVSVYQTIDSLEKSQVEVQVFNQVEERYSLFLWPGLLLLLAELAFNLSRWRRLP